MKKNDLQRMIKQARKSIGLNGDDQQELLRKVREVFEVTNEELAEALGYSGHTLMAYLAPEGTAKHRKMPEADKLVLARVLSEAKKK